VNPTHRACLLFHGFSGGPFEVEPLAVYLKQRGWSCRVPTLPGHGVKQVQPKNVQYSDWLKAAEKEAKALFNQYGEFDLIGFSMGGLISAYLANRYPIRRLVLLNAAVIYVSPARFIKVTLEQIKQRNWSRFRKIGRTPLRNTWQFMQLVRHLKPEISNIKTPTLIIQGDRDQVIHPYSATYIERHIQGNQKKVLLFPKSMHLICLGEEAQEVFKNVYEFLKK
jgi:carboxylesterase